MSKKDKRKQQEKSHQEKVEAKKAKQILTNAENEQEYTGADEDKVESEDFSTDWDLDKYRREYESEEHWELRRRFMEVHKKKFPEDKLVCLAQVFINMEFLGCKYPADTMQKVNELSKDVAKQFRASRENRLKRTFITASDAAETRAKGRQTNAATCGNNDNKQHQQHLLQQRQKQKQCDTNAEDKNTSQVQKFDFGIQSKQIRSPSNNDNDEHLKKKYKQINLFDGLKFGEFVITLNGGRNCIRQSCQRCNMEYLESEELIKDQPDRKTVKIYIDSMFVAEACEDNIKTSKAEAFVKALNVLQEHCYSIKQNPLRDTIKISKTKSNQVHCVVGKSLIDGSDEDKRLDATNKGYKMMKMMGWTGGGLGVQQQGRQNPVNYLLKNNRAGLGNDACHLDLRYFTQMLKNYITSDDIRELHFEPNFTKNERVMLHEIAKKFNLKSASYGQDNERHMIISKRTISDLDILKEVLLEKNPQYMDRYFVQVPTSKQSLFPEHTAKLSL